MINANCFAFNGEPDGQAEACAGTGSIGWEVWRNIDGTEISSVPYDTPPDYKASFTMFETPQYFGNNYGSRMRGYVCPPVTGRYVFWISSDDKSELWLSSDENPANKMEIASVAGYTKYREWEKYPHQVSVDIQLISGRKYYIEALHKEIGGNDHLSVGWHILETDTYEMPIPGNRLLPFEETPSVSNCADAADAGSVEREIWRNIPGTSVSSIPVTSDPDEIITLTSFQTGTYYANEYGSRIRGYVCVPFTGDYIFWIASDDNSELWLSSNADPVNKTKIASVTGATNVLQWNKYPSQKSVSVNLVAGQKYYIEVLHKEGGGNDHIALGWKLPSGILERPIPGNRISRFKRESNQPPMVTITHPKDNFEENFANSLTIYVDASDPDGTISKVEFYVNGDKLGEDLVAPYEMNWYHHPEGKHEILVIAYDNDHATASARSTYIYERPKCQGAGLLTWEVWPGIPGNDLSSVPFDSRPSYLDSRTLNEFETDQYNGNEYGSRIRANLCVPMTGNYTFWISSDDKSQLWLSDDANRGNKKLIAYVNGYTPFRVYNKYPSQESVSIYLEEGINYYIEALHKEANGNDHLSVGWRLPDGTLERPIPGKRLIGYEEEAMAAQTTPDEIMLYPNPTARRNVTLSLSNNTTKISLAEVQVISFTGEIVFSEKINCEAGCKDVLLNLKDNVPPGIYLVNVLQHDKRFSAKLVVR